MTTSRPPATAEANLRRNARWLARITAASMVPLVLFGISLVVQSPTWDQWALLGIFLVLGTASLLNVGLNQQGHSDAGLLLYLILNLGVYPAVAMLVSGVGLLLAAVCVFLNSAIAVVALSRRYLGPITVASAVVSLGVLLLDFYVPMPWRRPTPQPGIMFTFVIGLAIIYFAFMATQVRTFSLRAKLTLAFVAVTLSSVGLVALLTGYLTQQTLTQVTTINLQASARQVASQIDELLRVNLSAINAEAQNPTIVRYLGPPGSASANQTLAAEALATLRSFQGRDLANFSSAAIFNMRGVDILDTYGADIGLDKSDRDYFQIALSTGVPYASGLEFSQTTQTPSLYFSAAVRNAQGQIIGVLRYRFNADILQSLVARSNGLAGAESYPAVFDENLISLAHGTTPGLIYKALVPLDAARLAELKTTHHLALSFTLDQMNLALPELEAGLQKADSQASFSATLLAGQRAEVASARTQYQPWRVAYFVPEAILQAALQAQSQTLTVLAVLIAGLAAVAAAILAQTLAQPIDRLTRTAQRIAGGDLEAQAPVTSADEIGVLAQTFNQMTGQLRDTIGTLEQRVHDRTRAVETSAEVSRRLVSIADPQALVAAVVDEIQSAFGFYHAQVYLFDEKRENLVLMGGTGEAGRLLLSRGHKLPRGRGLVGRAAETNQLVLVSDTAADPGWLPNPLLPETRSEVAVPIAIADQVLGVLDVQHNVVDGLRQAEAALLASIAQQVAVALQNARTFVQTRQLARREALINAIGQKVQSATTVEEVLQVAVRELGQTLEVSRTSVQLGGAATPPGAQEKSV